MHFSLVLLLDIWVYLEREQVREMARMRTETEKPNAEEHLKPENRLLLQSP